MDSLVFRYQGVDRQTDRQTDRHPFISEYSQQHARARWLALLLCVLANWKGPSGVSYSQGCGCVAVAAVAIVPVNHAPLITTGVAIHQMLPAATAPAPQIRERHHIVRLTWEHLLSTVDTDRFDSMLSVASVSGILFLLYLN